MMIIGRNTCRLILGIILLSIWGGYGFAQVPTLPQNKSSTNTAGGMYARFCDFADEKPSLKTRSKIVVSPGKTYDLCVELQNLLPDEASMHVSFIDGQKDENGIQGCALETAKGIFGQYVSNVEDTYIIPGNTNQRITAKIKMPVSAAGTVYGCITVYNDTAFGEVQKKGGVATLVRNAIPLEILVDTKVEVGLELAPVQGIQERNLSSDPLSVTKNNDGSYRIAVGFKNSGGLDEAVEVSGTVSDMLHKTVALAPLTQTVPPEGYNDVRFTLPPLPWYKMWFTVDLSVMHHAVSEFRTEFITEQLLAKKTLTVHKTFFVFPWWLVGVLVVLMLIIRCIKRAQKRHQNKEKEMEELKKWKAEHGTPPQA